MADSSADRKMWVAYLAKVAEPVLDALAQRKLKATMPVEHAPKSTDRPQVTHLEALGRLLAGMAPWLECTLESGKADADEIALQQKFRDLARAGIDAGTHPASPDRMNFSELHQPLVDTAFLSHALIRAPHALYFDLPENAKRNLTAALAESRAILPAANNWLLFSAMVETAMYAFGLPWDRMRVDYALRQHEQWYKGDGAYGDGVNFHWDYYNSFVIQPMLVDVLRTTHKTERQWDPLRDPMTKRARRYAAIQERMIAPDGSYPVIGRSITYRCGAFQNLAQVALHQELPEGVLPAQVRSALTAVIQKTLGAPGTFDDKGFLRIGLCGHQPSLGEPYISTGSLYLCSFAFLPLGLPPTDQFWTAPAAPWTSQKAWTGVDLPADHAI